MEIFKNIPDDIVKYILSYDKRFSIRNGIIMNRLDTIKYENIIQLLENKPKPLCNNRIRICIITLSDNYLLQFDFTQNEYKFITSNEFWRGINGC
jgi:hypothetical protein